MDGHLDLHAMHRVPLAKTTSLSASETNYQHGQTTSFTKRNISEIWDGKIGGGGHVPRVPHGIYAYDLK